MPRQKSRFPGHLNLRLTVGQRTFLDDMSSLHGVKPSGFVRELIDKERNEQRSASRQVAEAIETLDRVLGKVE